MEEQLQDRGKLPVGMTLDTPQMYRDAQGKGEVWIDGDGLPLRLTVHMILPPERDGSHVEGDVRTDFSGFPAAPPVPAIAEDPVAWAGAALGVTDRSGDWARTVAENGRMLLAVASGAAAIALLFIVRRKRVAYAAVVIAVILEHGRRAAAAERARGRLQPGAAAQQAQQVQAYRSRRGSWPPR